jgi:Zn-dependent protease
MGNIIRNAIGKINAGIVALVLKIGPKILSLGVKFAKFLKIGKFGLAIVSMVSYAYLFTWQFAVMIMVLLFVHESGHIIAMKRCRLKTKGIYFIPFLGAAAVSEDMFKSRRDEAYIAIMGPIFGFVLSGISLVIYIATKNALFAAAAGWMAMINLFNLLPINPLDGGRIMKSIAFSINSKFGYIFLTIGIVISIILTFWAGIILFLFLLILGTLELFFEYKTRNANEVINRCIKDIDEIFDKNRPEQIQKAIDNIKSILLDKKEDPVTRINTVISIGEKFDESIGEIDYDTVAISHVISPILRRFDNMPKMTTRGVVITAIVYIATIVVLWSLMSYTSNIPEVEIARKFFMS